MSTPVLERPEGIDLLYACLAGGKFSGTMERIEGVPTAWIEKGYSDRVAACWDRYRVEEFFERPGLGVLIYRYNSTLRWMPKKNNVPKKSPAGDPRQAGQADVPVS